MVGSASHSYGGDGSRALNSSRKSSECSDAEKFPRAVSKIALVQICESAGFHSIQLSALETLADITIRYLCDLGKSSQFYANLAGRTQSNALDAVAALEDISGASFSDPHCPASSSVSVKELIRFVDYGDELPFAKPLPRFPVYKTRNPTPSFLQRNETPSHPHIPPWLPALPDPDTYMASSVGNENNQEEARLDNLVQTKQRRKAERSLVSLHLRLCTSGASTSGDINTAPLIYNNTASMGTSPPHASRSLPSEHLDASKLELEGLHNKAKSSKRPSACTQNPFLAPPLPPGAKEVSSLFLNDMKPPSPAPSTKKIVAPALPSMLDVFRPALEGASRDVQESHGSSKSPGGILPKERMPVLMTLDFGRRAKGKAVVASLGLGGKERKRGWTPFNADDNDEKKKRAEQILAQGMEGTDDDTQ